MFKNKKVKDALLIAKRRTADRMEKQYKRDLTAALKTSGHEHSILSAEKNSEIEMLTTENNNLHKSINKMRAAYINAVAVVKKNKIVSADLAAEATDFFIMVSACTQRLREIEQRANNHNNDMILEEDKDRKYLGLEKRK